MGIQEFREYCEAHQIDMKNPSESYRRHASLVERISKNPSLIGVRDARHRYIEVELRGRNGYQVGAIDLVLFDSTDVYICEVKCSRKPRWGTRAQLDEEYHYVKKKFRVLPVRVSVKLTEGYGSVQKHILLPEIEDILEFEAAARNGVPIVMEN